MVILSDQVFPRTTLIALLVTAMLASACAPSKEQRRLLPDLPLTANLGGDTSRPLATSEAFTFVAANASDATRASFAEGNAVFIQDWSPVGAGLVDADGLGPVFNQPSCPACHQNNGRGRAPSGPEEAIQSMLVRVSVPGQRTERGAHESVPGYGDQLQDRAVVDVPGEAGIKVHWQESAGAFADGVGYALRQPRLEIIKLGYGPIPGDTMFSARVANPLIGLGLLELISVQTLSQLADPKDSNNDGISGRMNIVIDLRDGEPAVGRFGWKANTANLVSQNAAAARDDMGITNTVLAAEVCQPEQQACNRAATHAGVEMSADKMNLLTIYTRWLAVPRQRGPNRPEVGSGFEVFKELGCGGCHIPTLVTGDDPGTPELSGQVIHPFTDLLLHDMGEGLADGRPDFLANGREWRTPPLWGIGLTGKVSGHTEFLHDGRARSLQEAILWHGGEAQNSRELFRQSDDQQRALLLVFLNSL
jgi:CxxC motif-containing protein (DUF1111 family)